MGKAPPLLFRWRDAIVRDERLSATDRHVALTLSLHMDLDGGGCRPGTRRLAHECARKRDTVIDSIHRLEKLGYLRVRRGRKLNVHGWSLDVSQYQAQVPQGVAAPGPSRGSQQVPLQGPKLFKSSAGNRSASLDAPLSVPAKTKTCDACGVAEAWGHADWCPVLEEKVS